jgi:serine/threonine protein phosphatase PrpC
VCV